MDALVKVAIIGLVSAALVASLQYLIYPIFINQPPHTPISPPTKSIDRMESTEHWWTSRENASLNVTRVPGMVNDAIKISYNLSSRGYAGIGRDADSATLSGTKGIKINYQGGGAPNTLEIVLTDDEGPAYVFRCNSSTATTKGWTQLEVPYSQFRFGWCSPGIPSCGTGLDLSKVDSIKFIVANMPGNSEKPGDIPGQGFVIIDEVEGTT